MSEPVSKKSPWPYAIAASLIGIIGLQVVLVLIATSNKPVMETGSANGYQASLTWDAERAAFAKARALGWSLDIDEGSAKLAYTLSKAGAPVTGLAGKMLITRADGRAKDRETEVVEASPGVYHLDRAGLPAGRYRVRAELTRAEDRWLDERWIMLP